jgi:polar amino acid transport system permease protein
MSGFDLLFGPGGWAPFLLRGALVTVMLAVATIPFGFGGGLVLALMKLSRNRVVRAVAEVYSTFFRGIPDLLSLFIIYFGLQALINHLAGMLGPDLRLDVDPAIASVIALSMVATAYSAEIWVSALGAVPRGQQEAGRALGLAGRQIFFLITWPNLIRVALPGLGNIWSVMLKDTSLVSTLAMVDLLRAAWEASKNTGQSLLFFGTAAAIYLVFSILSNLAQTRLERRLNKGFA